MSAGEEREEAGETTRGAVMMMDHLSGLPLVCCVTPLLVMVFGDDESSLYYGHFIMGTLSPDPPDLLWALVSVSVSGSGRV